MTTPENTLKLLNFLKSPLSDDLGLNFKATVALEKNTRRLTPFIEELRAIETRHRKIPDALKEMEDRKLEEMDEFLEKGENGKPIVHPNGSVKIKEDEESVANFRRIAEKYNKEYKEDIQKYNNKLMEWSKFFLEGEADVKIDMVSLEDIDFPKDKKFNKGAFSGLFVMIDMEDPQEEVKKEAIVKVKKEEVKKEAIVKVETE